MQTLHNSTVSMGMGILNKSTKMKVTKCYNRLNIESVYKVV